MPTAPECVHLVNRVLTSGHVTKTMVRPFDSSYPKTPLCTQTSRLCFTEPELLPIEVLHCGKRGCRPFLFLWRYPMTFIYELDPSRDIPDVRKWTSYVKAFESYRQAYKQTDRQIDKTEIIHHAASRVVNNSYSVCLSAASIIIILVCSCGPRPSCLISNEWLNEWMKKWRLAHRWTFATAIHTLHHTCSSSRWWGNGSLRTAHGSPPHNEWLMQSDFIPLLVGLLGSFFLRRRQSLQGHFTMLADRKPARSAGQRSSSAGPRWDGWAAPPGYRQKTIRQRESLESGDSWQPVTPSQTARAHRSCQRELHLDTAEHENLTQSFTVQR